MKKVTLVLDEEVAEWIWEKVLETAERQADFKIAAKAMVALGKAGCIEVAKMDGSPLTYAEALRMLKGIRQSGED